MRRALAIGSALPLRRSRAASPATPTSGGTSRNAPKSARRGALFLVFFCILSHPEKEERGPGPGEPF